MGAGLWGISGGDPQLGHLAAAVVLCLIPGRLHGWLWRDVYRSRRALDQEQFAEGLDAATSALETFRARPWLRHAGWLVGMVHTRYPEAMALNNRAVARIALNDLDRAGGDLFAAIQIDPTYALAHANLAGLLRATGDLPNARAHRAEAVALGLREDRLEQAMDRMAGLLAAVEG